MKHSERAHRDTQDKDSTIYSTKLSLPFIIDIFVFLKIMALFPGEVVGKVISHLLKCREF